MKATKFEMVKEIFFDATDGKRNIDNFTYGKDLIDLLVVKNAASFIRYYFDQYREGYIDAESALRRLVDGAYMNTTGANGMTETSKRLMADYYRFV